MWDSREHVWKISLSLGLGCNRVRVQGEGHNCLSAAVGLCLARCVCVPCRVECYIFSEDRDLGGLDTPLQCLVFSHVWHVKRAQPTAACFNSILTLQVAAPGSATVLQGFYSVVLLLHAAAVSTAEQAVLPTGGTSLPVERQEFQVFFRLDFFLQCSQRKLVATIIAQTDRLIYLRGH